MENIVRGEFYRVKNSSYCRNISISISILTLIYCIYLCFYKKFNTINSFYTYFFGNLNVLISIFALFNFVYQEEYTNKTIKNLIAISGNRVKIYYGKLTVQSVLALITYLMVVAVGVIMMFFLKPEDGQVNAAKVLAYFLLSIFIVMRALALVNVITVLTKNDFVSFFIYIILINQGHSILKVAASLFHKVNGVSEFLIRTQISNLLSFSLDGKKIFLMIFVNLIVCFIYNYIAMLIYKYKDIKC